MACLDVLERPPTGNAGQLDFDEILTMIFGAVLCGVQSAVDGDDGPIEARTATF